MKNHVLAIILILSLALHLRALVHAGPGRIAALYAGIGWAKLFRVKLDLDDEWAFYQIPQANPNGKRVVFTSFPKLEWIKTEEER